jgi:hypothetical protein
MVPVHETDPAEHVPHVPALSGIGVTLLDFEELDAAESPDSINATEAIRQIIIIIELTGGANFFITFSFSCVDKF